MTLSVAVQMDPIATINSDADSTFALMLEAQKRGHRLYHYCPEALALEGGVLTARVNPVSVQRVKGDHARLGPSELRDLSGMDVVLLRQDPPFDLAYITTTHLLERIHPRTLVVNDPVSVRNAPEKLLVTLFPDLMPPTLVTSDLERILEFRRRYPDMIVKPLFGNGGAGVFHLPPHDENLNSLIEMFGRFGREPLMVQAYLPAVREGDKRIILVDGQAVGAVNRVPKDGESRSNLHVGGTAKQSPLTDRDQEICDRIGPLLRDRGLLFVGIDVIGGMLTEINVTSPTGIQEIDRFDGTNIAALVWDAIEAKRRAFTRA